MALPLMFRKQEGYKRENHKSQEMRSKNNLLWGESSTDDSIIHLLMDIMHRIKENQLTGCVAAE